MHFDTVQTNEPVEGGKCCRKSRWWRGDDDRRLAEQTKEKKMCTQRGLEILRAKVQTAKERRARVADLAEQGGNER
jgi:hypothetical protein